MIVRERNLGIRDVLVPAAAVAIASFFQSVFVGVCVTFAVALALIIFVARGKPLPEGKRAVVLEIGVHGLVIRHRWVREVEIPWQDVEAMRLSPGRRGAVNLDIRVTEPDRYLNRFMRANLIMSRYHVCIRVSDLELSPEQIALSVEGAQKMFLKQLPGQIG